MLIQYIEIECTTDLISIFGGIYTCKWETKFMNITEPKTKSILKKKFSFVYLLGLVNDYPRTF